MKYVIAIILSVSCTLSMDPESQKLMKDCDKLAHCSTKQLILTKPLMTTDFIWRSVIKRAKGKIENKRIPGKVITVRALDAMLSDIRHDKKKKNRLFLFPKELIVLLRNYLIGYDADVYKKTYTIPCSTLTRNIFVFAGILTEVRHINYQPYEFNIRIVRYAQKPQKVIPHLAILTNKNNTPLARMIFDDFIKETSKIRSCYMVDLHTGLEEKRQETSCSLLTFIEQDARENCCDAIYYENNTVPKELGYVVDHNLGIHIKNLKE